MITERTAVHTAEPTPTPTDSRPNFLEIPESTLAQLNNRGRSRFFSWATNLIPNASTIKNKIPEIAAGIAAPAAVKYGVQGAFELVGLSTAPLIGAAAGGITAFGREYLHNRSLTESPPKREPLPIPVYLRQQRELGRLDDSYRNRLTEDDLVKPKKSDILMDSLKYNWDIIKKTRVREIGKGIIAGAAGGVIAGIAMDLFSFGKDLVNFELPKIELPSLPSITLPEISLPNLFQNAEVVKPDVAQVAGTTQVSTPFGPPPNPDRWYSGAQTLSNSISIPDHIQLHAGSNLSQDTMTFLEQFGDKLDLNEKNQIVVEVAKQSGVYVPGWPDTRGQLHTMLRPGFDLVFNEPVKDLIKKSLAT